jgi:hypothetical protein
MEEGSLLLDEMGGQVGPDGLEQVPLQNFGGELMEDIGMIQGNQGADVVLPSGIESQSATGPSTPGETSDLYTRPRLRAENAEFANEELPATSQDNSDEDANLRRPGYGSVPRSRRPPDMPDSVPPRNQEQSAEEQDLAEMQNMLNNMSSQGHVVGVESEEVESDAAKPQSQSHRNSKTPDPKMEPGMKVKSKVRITVSEDNIQSLSELPPLQTSPEKDAENARLYESFVKHGKIPFGDDRSQLVQYIQRQKVNAIISHDLTAARGFQYALQGLQHAVTDREVKERNQQRLENLDAKLEVAQEVLNSIQEETNRLISEELERQAERRTQLELKMDEELAYFEDHWNDREYLKRFARPSAYLIQLKATERSLILVKMFDEAVEVHKKVRDLEKQESQMAQGKANAEMEREKKKLISKHVKEWEVFDHYCQQRLEMIRHDQELKIKTIQARQTKLESEIEVWKANPPTGLPPIASAYPDFRKQPVMTPRTLRRLAAFKAAAKSPTVRVKPLGNVKPKRVRPKTVMGKKNR